MESLTHKKRLPCFFLRTRCRNSFPVRPVRSWTGLLKGGNKFRPQPLRFPRARRRNLVPALVSPASRRRCVSWGSPRTKAPSTGARGANRSKPERVRVYPAQSKPELVPMASLFLATRRQKVYAVFLAPRTRRAHDLSVTIH